MTTIIASLFERDLNKLIEEINLYKNEEDVWKIKDGISNSGGNLTLHLIGNLNHFIGATLGSTGYVRERDKEFSLKNIPRMQLTEDLKKTIEVIKNTLPGLSAEDLEKDFPVPINNKTSSTSYVLLHLLAHLSYHLGQVNYHRRLIG
ncbi:MAG TPA: DUF1572 family protein [Ginsengibacter sp.]|nr:DUF1572 family protein [Ginsengibacter sp.]